MSPLFRWLSRASGVLFVTLFGLVFAPTAGASFKIQSIEPARITCTIIDSSVDVGRALTGNSQQCVDDAGEEIKKITFIVESDAPLLDDFEYLVRIQQTGRSYPFGFSTAKKTAINANVLLFEWDLKGFQGITKERIATPGSWKLALYAPGKVEWATANQSGTQYPKFNETQKQQLANDTFIINEGRQKNPTFRAKKKIYPANAAKIELEILNTNKGTRYTVWWDGEAFRNTDTEDDFGTSKETGSTVTVPVSWGKGAKESGQKACMAPKQGHPASLKCNDYFTIVYFSAEAPADGGGPSIPQGNLNADPITGKFLTGGGVSRLIQDVRDYNRVLLCPDVQTEDTGVVIQTGIGCIPTTPSALLHFLLRFAIGIGGGAALLIMAFGSIQMMTAQGDPEKLNEGREKFVGALAGLLFIVFSIFLLNVIGVQIFEIPGFPK